jgi:8-oxo-dGTP pyrophosphatase MutT (NUDIX family)
MLDLIDGASPFARSSVEPGHFTASLFVLSPERDALALIFHKKLGIWVQPGGHVEAEDVTLADAARREAREEIGVSRFVEDSAGNAAEPAIFDVDVHPIPARPTEPAHHHFDVRFLLTACSRDLVVSDEVADARWMPLTEVHTVASDESVQRCVRKILAAR